MPSGLKATLRTAAVCPSRGWPTGCPVVASHKRTVRSALAEARRVPSGLKATLYTVAVCPARGWPTGCPVVASHRRTVRSALAEARRVPSGLKATLLHSSAVCLWRELAHLAVPVVGVPQAHRPVIAGRGQARAVGAEGHALHSIRVPLGEALARLAVPSWHPTSAPSGRRWPRPGACRRG